VSPGCSSPYSEEISKTYEIDENEKEQLQNVYIRDQRKVIQTSFTLTLGCPLDVRLMGLLPSCVEQVLF